MTKITIIPRLVTKNRHLNDVNIPIKYCRDYRKLGCKRYDNGARANCHTFIKSQEYCVNIMYHSVYSMLGISNWVRDKIEVRLY